MHHIPDSGSERRLFLLLQEGYILAAMSRIPPMAVQYALKEMR